MSRHPRTSARTRMATAMGLLLLVGTTPALADDWSIEFDRTVAIGGERWAGPSGVTLRYTPPGWAVIAGEMINAGGVPNQSGGITGT